MAHIDHEHCGGGRVVSRRKKITVPNWFDAERRIGEGQADPLDEFVYHNEPAGTDPERRFREQLQNLVDYLRKTHSKQ